jgi:hypothetical protein
MHDDKREILFSAIDHYNVLTKNQKKILKSLINLSIDGKVVATVNELASFNNTTRATISTAISLYKKLNIIEVPETTGVRFSSCRLKQTKLNEIISHFQNKKALEL